jgi:hypothetical protein
MARLTFVYQILHGFLPKMQHFELGSDVDLEPANQVSATLFGQLFLMVQQ